MQDAGRRHPDKSFCRRLQSRTDRQFAQCHACDRRASDTLLPSVSQAGCSLRSASSLRTAAAAGAASASAIAGTPATHLLLTKDKSSLRYHTSARRTPDVSQKGKGDERRRRRARAPQAPQAQPQPRAPPQPQQEPRSAPAPQPQSQPATAAQSGPQTVGLAGHV